MRWFAIVMLALLQTGTVRAQTNSKLPDAIDGIRPSVVKVVVKLVSTPTTPFPKAPDQLKSCFGDGRYCIAGTGFFVNSNGDVVTAFDVVDGFRGQDGVYHPGIKQVIQVLEAQGIPAEIGIGTEIPNIEKGGITIAAGTMYYAATVVATDPAHDLALIRPNVNPFTSTQKIFGGSGTVGWPQGKPKFVTLSVARPRDAEDIFACGYPFGESGLITTSGTVASAWNSMVLLRAAAAGDSTPVEVYNIDLRINPGNSGGPVFRLSDRALIGVAVQSLGSLGIAVPAKYVATFLTSQGVPWTSAKNSSDQPRGPKQHDGGLSK